jgi:hypothetical protein
VRLGGVLALSEADEKGDSTVNKNLIRWGAVTSAALVAAGLSLTVAGVAVAAPAAGLTGTLAADLSSTLNVDCSAVTSDNGSVYMAAGTTATVNITGTCDGVNGLYFETLDSSAPGTGGITVAGTHTAATASGSSITAPATMTVDPNTRIQIFKTGGVNSVGINFSAVDDSPNPMGSLGESTTLGLSSTASASNVMTVPGTIGSIHNLGGDAMCQIQSGEHVYAPYTVSVSASGEYTFRVVTTDPLTDAVVAWGGQFPIGDPYVAVYSTFDPNNPDSNIVGCNDDGDDNGSGTEYLGGTSATIGHTYLVEDEFPQFVKTLDAGTYTLVLTIYGEYSTAAWNGASFPAQSATFELWGPEGAFALADTGFATPSWVLPTGLSVVALGLAIGIASFVLRRRANS